MVGGTGIFQVTTIKEAKDFARLFILALCIWREARGESFRGKLLVGFTIKNRVKDPRWPNTYEGVITQRWQFSAFNPSDPNAILYPSTGAENPLEDAAWLECVKAAETVLNSTSSMTSANHYYAKNINPSWSRAEAVVEREGNHVFLSL